MSERPVNTSVLQQQWNSWSQAVRKKWTSAQPSGEGASASLVDNADSARLLMLEGGGSRHGSHRQRHNNSPRTSVTSVGKVRFNPLLTEVGLQLTRHSMNRSSSGATEQERALFPRCEEHVQESHNPLLSEISLRLPVSRLPNRGSRDDSREPHSYVLIGSDDQARNGVSGMVPSSCCSGCGFSNCCKCQKRRLHTMFKALVMIVMLAGLVALVVVFSRRNQLLKLLQWVDRHKLGGAAIFALLYTISTVVFVPVLPLAIGGGAVYGVLLGSAIVWVGATTGETAAFLIGRFLLRDLVKSKATTMPIWQALERAIRYEGWKIILLLRLAPLVPFALINYFLGASAARFNQFFWASILGIIPGIVVNVYLGSTIRQMIIIAHTPDEQGHSIHVHTPKSVQIAIVVVSAVAVMLALLLVGLYARRELVKIMNAHQPSELASPQSPSATASLQEHLPHSTASSVGRHSRSSSNATVEATSLALEAPHPVEMTHSASHGALA